MTISLRTIVQKVDCGFVWGRECGCDAFEYEWNSIHSSAFAGLIDVVWQWLYLLCRFNDWINFIWMGYSFNGHELGMGHEFSTIGLISG